MSVNISASNKVMIAGTLKSSGLGPFGGPGTLGDWFKPGFGGSYGGSGGASASELPAVAGEAYSIVPEQVRPRT
jgi:hypothetical protein